MSFSEKLKQLRTEQGLTQEQLANGVHVSRTLINKYEKGAVEPTLDNMKRIAEFFGVSENYFNEVKGSKTKFFSKLVWVDVVLLSLPVLILFSIFFRCMAAITMFILFQAVKVHLIVNLLLRALFKSFKTKPSGLDGLVF